MGTFESRPGNAGAGDYASPDPCCPPGSAQGDGPQGVLTSEPFTVGGDTISFLVGGGCDATKVQLTPPPPPAC